MMMMEINISDIEIESVRWKALTVNNGRMISPNIYLLIHYVNGPIS